MTRLQHEPASQKLLPHKVSFRSPIKDRALLKARTPRSFSRNDNAGNDKMINPTVRIAPNFRENRFDYKQKQCLFVLDFARKNASILTVVLARTASKPSIKMDHLVVSKLLQNIYLSMQLALRFTLEANEILNNDIHEMYPSYEQW